jgi:hypothetical protein
MICANFADAKIFFGQMTGGPGYKHDFLIHTFDFFSSGIGKDARILAF